MPKTEGTTLTTVSMHDYSLRRKLRLYLKHNACETENCARYVVQTKVTVLN